MCVDFSEALLDTLTLAYSFVGVVGYERVTCFVVLLEDWKVAWP